MTDESEPLQVQIEHKDVAYWLNLKTNFEKQLANLQNEQKFVNFMLEKLTEKAAQEKTRVESSK